MAILSPSILSANFCALQADCETALNAGATMLHYDVMDGHFVPNISFGVPVLAGLHRGLPDAFYDVHLMITHPLAYVDAFAKAGASLINFHIESADDPAQTLQAIRAAGCKTGLTIKPATAPEAVFPYLEALDMVLVMSVEPGFGGQSFMPAMLDKVSVLKQEREKRGLSFLIEIDGGVDQKTAPDCIAHGVDVLVAGSAVFGAPDIAQAVCGLVNQ